MNCKLVTNVILAIVLLLVFSGCDNNQPSAPLPAPVQKKPLIPKVQVSAEAPPVEQESLPVPYQYESSGRRDPFEPLTAIKRPLTLTEEELTPLQKYELGQFRLIGVIIGKDEPMAMVVAPDNKSFVLKKGTKIGRNNGEVVDIHSEAVLVKEQYFDFSGEIRENVQRLELPKRGGIE